MIEAIQFWNEPNNLSHWDYTLDPEWSTFAQMVLYASREVRSEAPGVTQLLGGLSPLDPAFADLMRRHGVADAMDVIALHGFPLDWNLWQIDEWPEKVQEMGTAARKPIWVTEVGASSFGAEEVQLFGLKRTSELLLSLVPRIHWYSLIDLPGHRVAVTRHKESEGSAYYRHFYFGLLRSDGTPKQALGHFPPEMGICQWVDFEDDDMVELDLPVASSPGGQVPQDRHQLGRLAPSRCPALVRQDDEQTEQVRSDGHPLLHPPQPGHRPQPHQPTAGRGRVRLLLLGSRQEVCELGALLR